MKRKNLFADAGQRLQNAGGAAEIPAPSATPVAAPVISAYANRLDKIDQLAESQVTVVRQLAIDPSICRPWSGNGRMVSALSEETCRDLIDAMLAEGGQKVPAIVRPLEGDEKYRYEVVAGIRRHFAVSWLRAHSYPDFKFLVEVQRLDDEAAFRLADQENRGRNDLSDVEKARNYAAAVDLYYGGSQQRLADRLRLSKGWLSKLLKLAELPDAILAAYPSLSAISVNTGYELSQLLSDAKKKDALLAEAAAIASEQDALRQAEKPLFDAVAVTRRLKKSAEERRGRAAKTRVPVYASTGKPLLSVVQDTAQFLTLKIFAGSGATEEEVIERLKEQLALARMSSKRKNS